MAAVAAVVAVARLHVAGSVVEEGLEVGMHLHGRTRSRACMSPASTVAVV